MKTRCMGTFTSEDNSTLNRLTEAILLAEGRVEHALALRCNSFEDWGDHRRIEDYEHHMKRQRLADSELLEFWLYASVKYGEGVGA